MKNFHYLEGGEVNVGGFTIWGGPWTPWFNDWAFNVRRCEALRDRWLQIPVDIDILVTHGPPKGMLDLAPDGESVGCEELRRRLEIVSPLLHVFGHIHGGYGQAARGNTHFVNASICNEAYEPVNPPVVVEL